jgi:hypothetical protein
LKDIIGTRNMNAKPLGIAKIGAVAGVVAVAVVVWGILASQRAEAEL